MWYGRYWGNLTILNHIFAPYSYYWILLYWGFKHPKLVVFKGFPPSDLTDLTDLISWPSGRWLASVTSIMFHMVMIWLLYGYDMVIIWLLYGYHMVMILWYGYDMVIVWWLETLICCSLLINNDKNEHHVANLTMTIESWIRRSCLKRCWTTDKVRKPNAATHSNYHNHEFCLWIANLFS